MTDITPYLLSLLALISGGAWIFLMGRSSGADKQKREFDLSQANAKSATDEVRKEVRSSVSEIDKETNAQTRDDLIDSLAGDSVRKPKG